MSLGHSSTELKHGPWLFTTKLDLPKPDTCSTNLKHQRNSQSQSCRWTLKVTWLSLSRLFLEARDVFSGIYVRVGLTRSKYVLDHQKKHTKIKCLGYKPTTRFVEKSTSRGRRTIRFNIFQREPESNTPTGREGGDGSVLVPRVGPARKIQISTEARRKLDGILKQRAAKTKTPKKTLCWFDTHLPKVLY